MSKIYNWRWISTPSSFASCQASVLAVVEAVIAMLFYVAIAVNVGTWHLLVATITVPVLLLRTPASIERGLRWYLVFETGAVRVGRMLRPIALPCAELVIRGSFLLARLVMWLRIRILRRNQKYSPELVEWMAEIHAIAGAILFPLIGFAVLLFCSAMGTLLFLWAMLVKVAASVSTVIQHPWSSVKSVPRNWYAQVVCLDFAHPIEILPGVVLREKSEPSGKLFSLQLLSMRPRTHFRDNDPTVSGSRLERAATSEKNPLRWVANPTLALTLPIMLMQEVMWYIFFVPAIIYRWSIKGTWILWMPLAWVVDRGLIRDFAEGIKNQKYQLSNQIGLALSGVTLVAILLKVMAFSVFQGSLAGFPGGLDPEFVRRIIAPSELPLWQVAAGIGAMISFGLAFVADWARTKSNCELRSDYPLLAIIVRALWALRACLGCVSLSILVWHLWVLAPLIRLPPTGTFLLPEGMPRAIRYWFGF